ncbi:hypothetical protein [Microbacterium murale]|uniref:DUF559 domain-containing protein n=1 Tax=Microbacterium murale TaxID=1081040 RepID=A0ABQ1RSH7_9MICO|nr:hypothetical protein [Microbacterium murale]GGD75791.1 hypothetical protein GCM10007269_18610 [Microbacterium murale]
MPPTPNPLPDSLGGQFSVRDAERQGATRRRMRAKDLTIPFRGTRRTAEFITQRSIEASRDDAAYAHFRRARKEHADDARVYSEIMPPGSFYCAATAAIVGYALPLKTPTALAVAVFAPQRAPRAKGVKGRKVAPHLVTITEIDGLRMTTPTSTWAMLARDLTLRELVEIGDAIVQVPRDDFGRQHPELSHGTIADLAAEVSCGPRPPSTGKLREALELICVGSSSVLETDFRLDAASAGLPEPVLDMEIRDDRRRLLGISELVYPQYRIVVEIEGDHHRTSRKQWNRDLDKYNDYAEAGWEVVRLTSLHVNGSRRDGVGRVAAALRRRGWNG